MISAMQVTPSSLQRRLAALETRAGARAQGIRVQPFPDDVEDVAVDGQVAEDVVVVITGVPLVAIERDTALDHDLVSEVRAPPCGEPEVAIAVVEVGSLVAVEAGLLADPDSVARVHHGLAIQLQVTPGYSVVDTGLGQVPMLQWIRR